MIMTLELEYIHNIIGLCQSLLDVQIVARKKEKKEGRKEGRKKERKKEPTCNKISFIKG
jgi:hypothetical protein